MMKKALGIRIPDSLNLELDAAASRLEAPKNFLIRFALLLVLAGKEPLPTPAARQRGESRVALSLLVDESVHGKIKAYATAHGMSQNTFYLAVCQLAIQLAAELLADS